MSMSTQIYLEELNIPKDIVNIITSYTKPSILKHVLDIGEIMCCLAALPNGDVAIGTNIDFIIIMRNDLIVDSLTGHTGYVNCLVVLPNSNLASGSSDKTIKIWNDYLLYRTLIGHTGCVNSLAVLNNGNLASGSIDNTIKIWKDNLLLYSLYGHTTPISNLVGLPNGDLASASIYDSIVRIWRNFTELSSFVITDKNDIHRSIFLNLAVLSNGDLVTGHFNGDINIWRNNKLINSLDGHGHGYSRGIRCLTVIPGDYLVSGSGDTTIKIWKNGKLYNSIEGHTCCVQCLTVLPNGNLVSGSNDGIIKTWC